MLSYLHDFHAGNHADVLKHVVLVQLIERLTIKAKPLRYIDTHAGAGGYDLTSERARKNHEYQSGIGRLWAAPDPPSAVRAWLTHVRAYNGGSELRRYPGSPALAQAALRASDRLHLCELHPAEHRRLERAMQNDRRVAVLRADGLRDSIGLLPPPERRGVVLIDPSYETAGEQAAVIEFLGKALRRFATGVYAVWYPIIDRSWVTRCERALRSTVARPIDVYELTVTADGSRPGLTGSGVWVVNPPWQARQALADALPWLVAHLRETDGATARAGEL